MDEITGELIGKWCLYEPSIGMYRRRTIALPLRYHEKTEDGNHPAQGYLVLFTDFNFSPEEYEFRKRYGVKREELIPIDPNTSQGRELVQNWTYALEKHLESAIDRTPDRIS